MHWKDLKRAIFTVISLLCIFLYGTAQNVGINASGTIPDASATLDLNSTTGGLLIPRMTSAQRDAINGGTVANALMIYNVTTQCFEVYYTNSSAWVSMFCLGCQIPTSFSSSSATNIGSTGFDANWSSSLGATKYFIDVDDNSDFSSPITGFNNLDVGNVLTVNVTGLTCGTTYYYRVRAGNDCGTTTNTTTITANTSNCCASATAPVNVTSASGAIWMDRNLGATQVATSASDANSYGDAYQWGRCTDGHESRTSGTTSTLSGTDTPGHANFITSGAPNDWRNPQNDNLWQGVNGINNPCPSGYRIPTIAEWETERLNFPTNNASGAYNSLLKLPSAGWRGATNGVFNNVGSVGDYWSSTVNGTTVSPMYFTGSNVFTLGSSTSRGNGMSARCIQD